MMTGKRIKSLSAVNTRFVESFTSERGRHHRSADGRKRRRKRGLLLACTLC